jgi:hypothetical protein
MQGGQRYARHLNENQYHPRSDAHSNALCRAVLADLLDHCPPIARKAADGQLVAQLNHTVTVGYQRWNIDLALGPPSGAPNPPEEGERIRFEVPTVIELAVEAKGVMTEHGKARHNRLRDLQAFHDHAHTYNKKVVAGGILVVNVADVYWSPTRDEGDITEHGDIDRIGEETVGLYRNIPLRNDPSDGGGMEGMGVLVVRHDNLRKNPNPPPDAPSSQKTTLVTDDPAPPSGDPLNYSTMIYRLCRSYEDRWV